MTAQKLRIEPIQSGEPQHEDLAEFSILDEEGDEVAVVTGLYWARRLAVADELLEVVIKYVSECGECDGTGEIGGFVNAESGYQTDPCPECSPVRELIGRAGGVV